MAGHDEQADIGVVLEPAEERLLLGAEHRRVDEDGDGQHHSDDGEHRELRPALRSRARAATPKATV